MCLACCSSRAYHHWSPGNFKFNIKNEWHLTFQEFLLFSKFKWRKCAPGKNLSGKYSNYLTSERWWNFWELFPHWTWYFDLGFFVKVKMCCAEPGLNLFYTWHWVLLNLFWKHSFFRYFYSFPILNDENASLVSLRLKNIQITQQAKDGETSGNFFPIE